MCDRRLILLLLAVVTPWFGAVWAEGAVREAKVTYFTGATVYLDAGARHGLKANADVTIMRGNEVIAKCLVTQVSTGKSACAIERELAQPVSGDTALYVFETESAEESEASALESSSRGRHSRGGAARQLGLRGRVGVRYLTVRDHESGGADYTQPAFDVRLDGDRIAGSDWGLNVDIRTRRTSRRMSDGTAENEKITRVYRAAVSRRDMDDPWSFVLGRQFSPALAAVSIFDGVSAEYGRERWAVGLLSGSQPDPVDHGYATTVSDHGVYVQFKDANSRRRWALTTGLIGSYEESEVNREFVYVQARVNGPKLSVYAIQEVDYNRGWKSTSGEDTTSMTSTFTSLNYRAGNRIFLRGGYDSRRNVRLYHDFVNPEIEFDDSFRQGVWAGVTTRIAQRLSISLDGRTNDGGTAGRSDSYTISANASRLLKRFNLRARTTRYENDIELGWLHSLSGGIHIGRKVQFEIGGGLRREEPVSLISEPEELRWVNADLDILVGKHWYLILSADSTRGATEDLDQYYTGLTYRF